MRKKRLMIVTRALLLVAALLLSTTALAGTLGYYNWKAATTGFVGEFTNNSTGGGVKANTSGASSIGLYGYATGATAQATRGYNTNGGYGVYGRSVTGTGVYGENNGTSDGYAGYFTGYFGARGVATAWGGWFSSYEPLGVGVRGYSGGASGYGVYGSNPENIAVYGDGGSWGGYFVGTGDSGEGAYAYASSPSGDALEAEATGSSGYGLYVYTSGGYGRAVSASTSGPNAYAGYFTSSSYRGLYANGATGQYDLYVPDYAYIAGTVFGPKGTASLVARNDGAEALAPGDLVVLIGMDSEALDNGVLSVARAGAAEGVVVGVAQGAYVVETAPAPPPAPQAKAPALPLAAPGRSGVDPAPIAEGEEAAVPILAQEEPAAAVEAPPPMPAKDALADADSSRFAGGPAGAGQYLLVAFEGLVKVNLHGTRPVKAGDWIVVGPDGSVTSAPARAYSDALNKGCFIVGRAMEALGSGSGEILVRLDLR